MFKRIINEKRTFLLFATDIYVLTGVIFFDWNPERIVYFFGVDVGLCLLSFVVYNILIKGIDFLPSAFWVSLMILIPLFFLFKLIFVPPYFDVGTFLIFCVMSHVFDVKKYLSYNTTVAQPGFSLYVGILFLMIPALPILAAIINLTGISNYISLIIAYILVRHFTEYKRYKKFIEIEREINFFREKETDSK